MIEVRRAGRAEAEFVVDRAWERGLAEYDRGRDEMRGNLTHYCEFPDAFAIVDGDTPLAFLGALEVAPDHFCTWFQATDEFVRKGVRATVVFRRFIAKWIAEHPGATLDICTATDHAAAPRWFNLIGFTKVEQNPTFTRYRYDVEFVERGRSTTYTAATKG